MHPARPAAAPGTMIALRAIPGAARVRITPEAGRRRLPRAGASRDRLLQAPGSRPATSLHRAAAPRKWKRATLLSETWRVHDCARSPADTEGE
jgi:hypothetical protein